MRRALAEESAAQAATWTELLEPLCDENGVWTQCVERTRNPQDEALVRANVCVCLKVCACMCVCVWSIRIPFGRHGNEEEEGPSTSVASHLVSPCVG